MPYGITITCLLLSVILAVPLSPVYPQSNLHIYDSKFFSIGYPYTWHVKIEQGVSTGPGISGVTLTKNDTNFSGVAVTVMTLPSTLDEDSVLLDVFMRRSFSPGSIERSGDHFVSSNSTFLSGFGARTVTWTSESTFFFTAVSAYKNRVYEVGYGGPIDKYQDDMQEVKTIVDSFKIKF